MKKTMSGLTLFSLILLCACTGPEGPTGPRGDPGPGSRVVYQSTTAIPLDFWPVEVREITLDDMPSVTVFLSLPSTPGRWFQATLYLETQEYHTYGYTLEEGQVTFVGDKGFIYKIVIVS